jgi:hypothetical protein
MTLVFLVLVFRGWSQSLPAVISFKLYKNTHKTYSHKRVILRAFFFA